jgi:NAD(P)-dependent dehydrogenase (short-subunit alcohol dehydrogenase family)
MTGSSRLTLAGRVVLITGATRGIGRATAEALANLGATVIVHGRDPARVAATTREIARKAGTATVERAVADLSSLAEVRGLATDIAARHARLDVLINNAGGATRRRETTVDGFERQFAVNHLAPFLLTNLLLELLGDSAPARIVTVASNAHHRAAFDLDDLNWERRPYHPLGAYGATKLANILFTRELARQLEGTKLTANCLHPGVVATNIFSGLGILGSLFGVLSRPFLLSSRAGAETSIYLAAANELAATSGEFFAGKRLASPSPAALDDATARRLWQRSAEMTGLPNTGSSG